MTCSCELSDWLRVWLTGFGAELPYVGLALLLLWWARRAVRREHFGSIRLSRALAYNAPAFALFALGAIVLLLAMLLR